VEATMGADQIIIIIIIIIIMLNKWMDGWMVLVVRVKLVW